MLFFTSITHTICILPLRPDLKNLTEQMENPKGVKKAGEELLQNESLAAKWELDKERKGSLRCIDCQEIIKDWKDMRRYAKKQIGLITVNNQSSRSSVRRKDRLRKQLRAEAVFPCRSDQSSPSGNDPVARESESSPTTGPEASPPAERFFKRNQLVSIRIS